MELEKHNYFQQVIVRAREDYRLTSFDVDIVRAIAELLAIEHYVEYAVIHQWLKKKGFDRHNFSTSIDKLFRFNYVREKLGYVKVDKSQEEREKGHICCLFNPASENEVRSYCKKNKNRKLKELFVWN